MVRASEFHDFAEITSPLERGQSSEKEVLVRACQYLPVTGFLSSVSEKIYNFSSPANSKNEIWTTSLIALSQALSFGLSTGSEIAHSRFFCKDEFAEECEY